MFRCHLGLAACLCRRLMAALPSFSSLWSNLGKQKTPFSCMVSGVTLRRGPRGWGGVHHARRRSRQENVFVFGRVLIVLNLKLTAWVGSSVTRCGWTTSLGQINAAQMTRIQPVMGSSGLVASERNLWVLYWQFFGPSQIRCWCLNKIITNLSWASSSFVNENIFTLCRTENYNLYTKK